MVVATSKKGANISQNTMCRDSLCRAGLTYDPFILNTGLLDRGRLLELLRSSGSLLLGFDVSRVDKVADTSDGGSSDQVNRKKLEVEPVFGRLNDLNFATVSVKAMLLAGLLVVDQKAELDIKLLGLEFGHKVEWNLDGSAADGSKRSRLEGSGGHVAKNAASLSVLLFRI